MYGKNLEPKILRILILIVDVLLHVMVIQIYVKNILIRKVGKKRKINWCGRVNEYPPPDLIKNYVKEINLMKNHIIKEK